MQPRTKALFRGLGKAATACGAGEVYSTMVENRIAAVRATVDAVKGRMPVVAGVAQPHARPQVSIMKSAMEMVGLHGGPVRPPLCDTRAEDVADLRKADAVVRGLRVTRQLVRKMENIRSQFMETPSTLL